MRHARTSLYAITVVAWPLGAVAHGTVWQHDAH